MENFNSTNNNNLPDETENAESIFDARTITPNPRTYTINIYNETFDPSAQPNIYLSANYTNPYSPDQDQSYIGITYINSNNLTSIELPTENEQLMAAALKICNNIKRELRNLDDLMLGVIELRSMPLL